MAKSSKKKEQAKPNPVKASLTWLRRWVLRYVVLCMIIVLGVILVHRFVPPPKTFYMGQEARRLGAIDYQWVAMDDIAPVMARSVVAAEDANFCTHWGFDIRAIRAVIEEGSRRGASTLSQQVVKNTYLWHGRSYGRKALEALMTPAMEMLWPKRRIVEVYLNIAEFDEGVFGVDAAAQHYFGVKPRDLSALQAARLAAILPDPKGRSASKPSDFVRRRTASIMDGAATILLDGRAACFED